MTNVLPLLPIGIFFAVLLTIGYITSYRANRAAHFKKEYFLGSQNLGGIVLAMTLVATYGSVSSFISGPGVAWNLGLGWVVFAAPQIITAFLILGMLGKRMTILAHRTDSLTVIDLLFERFKSRTVSFILAVMMVLFFTAMIVGQFIGGAQIFAGLTGIDYSFGLIIFALVTVLYSSGGFRAVAITDAVCAFLMLLGMFILAYVIISEGGGIAAIMDTLSKVNIDEATGISRNLEFNAGGNLSLGLLFSSWVLVGFATVGLPQSLVRCMGYKSSHDLHKSMIIATVVCGALMIGMTMLGVLSRAVITEMPKAGTDAVIPTLLATKMHPIIAGVTILGPLAATMSTVSSLLIAAASAIIRDLFKSLHRDSSTASASKPSAAAAAAVADSTAAEANAADSTTAAKKSASNEEHELIKDASSSAISYHEKLIARGTTMVMGVVAITLALFPMDIVVWVNLFAFGGLESAFVWPIILGMFWRRFNTCGLLTSIALSLSVYAIFMIFKLPFFGCHSIVPAMLAGLIGAFIGTYIGSAILGQRMSKETHMVFFPHKPMLD
ncbi:MAG: sodium/pantothenate symporter [Anaerobiospirillum succiniciproducens]|uniref:sodium/pantothenate symporter n=1 Tax=Anaerobiospirillum succiniciproducens TaxID=13335 RepID=UPI0026DD19E2|nr:sodium/pantothenate symporter [Anaerobiospirillum succiniciproducens]MDO4675824.1 sodium/pantothenate symporter [Anaerobiospirillum succiniciproducens]